MVASHKIAPPDISDTPFRTANVSERASDPAPRPAAPSEITPRQRWAHLLVLDMINANLPLARLADHLKIPFDKLIASINTPEVQAEINAYEALTNLRARLIGEFARPISLRRLLDVLESPAPRPAGRDPESDQRALHRHAELIRRTATTIARESRALAPKAASKPAPRTANVSERTSGPRNAEPSDFAPSGAASPRRAPSEAEPELVHETPAQPKPTNAHTIAEDARGCASPEPVDAPTPQPTGSTDPANAPAHAAHPAPTPSAPSPIGPSAPSVSGSSPSDPSPPSSPRPSAALRVESESPPRPSAFNSSSRLSRSSRSTSSPRSSALSADSAVSSSSPTRARDHPA